MRRENKKNITKLELWKTKKIGKKEKKIKVIELTSNSKLKAKDKRLSSRLFAIHFTCKYWQLYFEMKNAPINTSMTDKSLQKK